MSTETSSTDASQPCKPQSPLNPCTGRNNAPLLLSDGIIYIGLGGDGNRGALFAFRCRIARRRRCFWEDHPPPASGGIWQSGQGPAAHADGNVYLMRQGWDV